MTSSRIKLLCFAQGDIQTPSSRERLFKLLPLLGDRGIDAIAAPLTRSLTAGNPLRYLRLARQADVILIQKRLMFPAYVALLRSLAPVIYDFDDALYAAGPNDRGTASRARLELVRFLLRSTLQQASLAIVGNEELARFALRYCRTVKVVPTAFAVHPSSKQHADTETITIGWTGTRGNLAYLKRMPAILDRLNARRAGTARIRVVCSAPLGRDIPYVDFKQWRLEDEAADFLGFDIGIMPLADDDWARGKCGFKLLQYSSFGLPVVASPVGANREVVMHGESGFLAGSDDEWVGSLELLAKDAQLRQTMGRSGREHVRCNYAPEAAADQLAEAIGSVVSRTPRAVKVS